MEINDNRTCYYFDDIININDLYLILLLYIIYLIIFYWMKKHMKIFQFMMLHAKLRMVQSLYALFLIK